MEHLNTLQDLFVHDLRDLYSAETQMVQALPKMAEAATSLDLRDAFNDHLEETRNHVQRLERIFSNMGIQAGGVTCEAMKGLIEEGNKVIRAQGDRTVKDAALIGAAQRIEHYEIAGYGTARAYAEQLDNETAADLLDETLDEEADADDRLNGLATGNLFESGINEEAMVQ